MDYGKRKVAKGAADVAVNDVSKSVSKQNDKVVKESKKTEAVEAKAKTETVDEKKAVVKEEC